MPSNYSDTDTEINEADMDPFDRRMAIIMATVDEIRGEPGSALHTSPATCCARSQVS